MNNQTHSDISPRVTDLSSDDVQLLGQLADIGQQMMQQLKLRIIGQDDVLEQVLITLFAGGHGLLVGVPGLAKTLLVNSLAQVLDLQFSRIQFTPDLMPSDITGTEVIQEDRSSGERHFRFIPGPVFANIVLADEINRTPPKTQAALLEAMQEKQVTAAGVRHSLPNPFFVLATQNPIEQEGTYPLPEAQLDRFMCDIRIGYMSEEDELEVVLSTTGDSTAPIARVLNGADLQQFVHLVRRIPVAATVARYATRLARLTRPSGEIAATNDATANLISRFVQWGAGPRASQFLVLGGKARAALAGRPMVQRADIDAIAKPVLRHRMRLNFAARAEGWTTDGLIDHLLEDLKQSNLEESHAPGLEKVFRSQNTG